MLKGVKRFLMPALAASLVACAQPKKDADKAAFRAMGESLPTVESRPDEAIGLDVRHQIALAGANDLAAVVVMIEDGVVTLRGSVTSQTAAYRAESAARVVKGVKAVVNNIRVVQAAPVY